MAGLAGLQVLELAGGSTSGTAAGTAGRLLADLGATVVKVEPPEGDPTRRRGPFKDSRTNPEASGDFLFLHANKRSVVLDLAQPPGREALAELAARAHLLIHDWTPPELSASGLDIAALMADHPALVVLALSPFGQSGPYRDWAATDLTLIHGGGWGWLCPGRSEEPELPPIKPYGQHVLVQAGVHGAAAALAAVRAAAKSGRGEHIDLSIQEVVINLLGRFFGGWSYARQDASRLTPGFYEPYSFYPCQDGWVFLITPENEQFKRLVEVMGRPAWATEELQNSRPARKAAQKDIKRHIIEWTRTQRAEDVFHACQKARVGAAPLYTTDRLAHQEHLVARDFFASQHHPVAGDLTMPGAPYKLRDP